jgi:hypothetical protein
MTVIVDDFIIFFASGDESVDNRFVYTSLGADGVIRIGARNGSFNYRADATTTNYMDGGWHHLFVDVSGSWQVFVDTVQLTMDASAGAGNNGWWTGNVTGRDNRSFGRLERLTPGGLSSGGVSMLQLYPFRIGATGRAQFYHDGRTSGY